MKLLSRLNKTICFASLLLMASYVTANKQESVCYGLTSNGELKNGYQLPMAGYNFKAYSTLGWALGRTYVHSQVAEVILDSYQSLHKQLPTLKFMYAETGWAAGGQFAPHKTHQNGLSVDFMVPVLNEGNQPDFLPISVSNKWGYDIEFNQQGAFGAYKIDFEAMASHLKSLHQFAQHQGIGINRVFFDPRFQKQLFNTKDGSYIKTNIKFNSKQAWVRHDEHYHVDFEIPCEPL